MSKELQVDREISSFPVPEDAKFFGETCRDIVKNADENAFIIISDVAQTLGEGFREKF